MRLTYMAPGLVLLLGCSGLVHGAETNPAPAVEASPVQTFSSSQGAIIAADQLAEDGNYSAAIAILQKWLDENPKDQTAYSHLLSIKNDEAEANLRKILNEQSSNNGMITSDAEYENARERSDEDVKRRLKVVEYYVTQNRFPDAALGCKAILRDHPHDPATELLRKRILETVTKKERKRLEEDRSLLHDEAMNDVIEDNTFPRDKPKAQRQVFIFQEDLDENQRAEVKKRLQERITLNQDQAKVWDVMKTMFAVAGINYVVVDNAIGDETLSLHIENDTVESVLNVVGKLAKIRFSYTDGTVFVSSDADDGLVSEIIRLRSGLTNVDEEVQGSSFGEGDSSSGSGGSGGSGGGNYGNDRLNRSNGNNNSAQRNTPKPPTASEGKDGQSGKNDLEKFLEKLPDIITGWQDTHKYFVDHKSNTLYLRASPWVISEVKRLLHAMDYNNVQVLIESKFVELTEEAMRTLGVDWGAFQGTDATSSTMTWATGSGTPTSPVANVTKALAGGQGGFISGLVQNSNLTLNATLKALESDGKADFLAEPKILTLNNASGVIEIVNNYTYIETYNVQTYSDSETISNGNVSTNSRAVATPQWQSEDIGYQLKITPSIARNSNVITLKLKPTVRQLFDKNIIPDGFEYFDQGQRIAKDVAKPQFTKRTLSTVLHVENGSTVALGGLANEETSINTVGTPFISHIPVLGWLFKTESRSSKRRNLIILVTAHLVEPNGQKIGDEIEHLRDTARILLPDTGIKGFEPNKPVMLDAAHPGGPETQTDTTQKPDPVNELRKGRRN